MQLGDRVVMSPLGYERLVFNFDARPKMRVTLGTAVRFGDRTSLGPRTVWVRRDGHKTAKPYAIEFWKNWR